jgi:hypothetical protein
MQTLPGRKTRRHQASQIFIGANGAFQILEGCPLLARDQIERSRLVVVCF